MKLNTNMTLMGKVFMVLFFLAVGFAGGVVYMKTIESDNSGNQISVSVDGKVKKDGKVNVNIEGNEQSKKQNRKRHR